MSVSEIMWVEKYRPKNLSDIINQKEIIIKTLQFLISKVENEKIQTETKKNKVNTIMK